MAAAAAPFSYRFGNFDLQPLERRLLARGEPVPVGPHALDVLLTLVRKEGRLVTKDELRRAVWPQVVVEDNALQAQVSALRKILGPRAIKTVVGRGYRFDGAVTPVHAAPPEAPLHNLPPSTTRFIGRESDCEALRQLLGRSRILTLTGAGGCGKTRLALQLAQQQLGQWRDGVWLAELATLSDGRQVAQALARVLQVREDDTQALTQTLAAHLASRRMLLVLDNAEHLLPACAAMVEHLLARCPGVCFLVTSRAPLGVVDEHRWRVPSLAVPPAAPTLAQVADSESVRLFMDRAAGFAVTGANAAVLASLCRRLDGIPLAIELAAARLRSMPLEEIEHRLDQRFALLRAGGDAPVPRHRTLRSLIDWSFDLLSAAEQAVLRRLSHFNGGCTAASAQEVCAGDGVTAAEVEPLLRSLAEKSLVVAQGHGEFERFRLLDTVRHYALERSSQAGEDARCKALHFACFAGLGERLGAEIRAGDQAAAVARFPADHDNFHAALAWAMRDGDISAGLRLATSLHELMNGGWQVQARDMLQQLLGTRRDEQTPAARGSALTRLASGHTWAGQYGLAIACHEEALALGKQLNDADLQAFALWGLALVAMRRGELARAKPMLEEAIALHRSGGDALQAAHASQAYARVVQLLGDVAGARAILLDTIDFYRARGSRIGEAATLYLLAGLCYETDALDEARRHAQDALVIQREMGRRPNAAFTLRLLGSIDSRQGHFRSARDRVRECLHLLGDDGERSALTTALQVMGDAWRTEQPLRSARLWGAMERLRQQTGMPMRATELANHQGAVAQARDLLQDDGAFDAAWQEAAGWSLEQAIAFALQEA